MIHIRVAERLFLLTHVLVKYTDEPKAIRLGTRTLARANVRQEDVVFSDDRHVWSVGDLFATRG